MTTPVPPPPPPVPYHNDQLINMKMGHLSMIQGVITRMSGISAAAKTFTVTILAGLAAISLQADKVSLGVIAILATAVFLCTDIYYLMLEIRFRNLYDHVATRPLAEAQDLSINQLKRNRDFSRAVTSRPTILFYASVLLAASSFALYGSLHDLLKRRLPEPNTASVKCAGPNTDANANANAKPIGKPVLGAAAGANGPGQRLPGPTQTQHVGQSGVRSATPSSSATGNR
jgi:hypothetical protein